MYYYKLISDIENYIDDEMMASKFYSELSNLAPSRLSKEMLIEFSADERKHAENFAKVYFYLTGRIFMPRKDFILRDNDSFEIDNYVDALKSRLLLETKDYKKYGEQYIDAPNKYLKNLFFATRSTEAQHAMRIPILFEDI